MSLNKEIQEGEDLLTEIDKPGQSEKSIRLSEHVRVALILAKSGEASGFDPAKTLVAMCEGLKARQKEISNGNA